MPTDSSAPATLECSKCAASLPDGAQYCLKCGVPVRPPAQQLVTSQAAGQEPVPRSSRPKPRRYLSRWTLLALLLMAILWVAASDNPYAQAVQEFVGWKHDEAILDESFAVAPRSFQYYKFALPQASTNVVIVGQYAASPENGAHGRPVGESDSGIEVYVLSDSAFAVWQKGYTTGSIYESGRVDSGKIQADLPAGAGVYYLIFNNKFSTKAGKKVEASALLRYKSWLPRWIRGLKNSVSDWLGL